MVVEVVAHMVLLCVFAGDHRLGNCLPGQAKMSEGFELPAKRIFHTAVGTGTPSNPPQP